jgi:hypothetical protein
LGDVYFRPRRPAASLPFLQGRSGMDHCHASALLPERASERSQPQLTAPRVPHQFAAAPTLFEGPEVRGTDSERQTTAATLIITEPSQSGQASPPAARAPQITHSAAVARDRLRQGFGRPWAVRGAGSPLAGIADRPCAPTPGSPARSAVARPAIAACRVPRRPLPCASAHRIGADTAPSPRPTPSVSNPTWPMLGGTP